MSRLLEKEDRYNPFQYSHEVYQSHIHPGMRGVVVGPGMILKLDPTLFLLSTLLNTEKSELYVVDPKFRDSTHDCQDTMKTSKFGIGNYSHYQDQLQNLHDNGLHIKVPTYLGPQIYAQNISETPLVNLNGTVDVVVDHCFLGFLFDYTNYKMHMPMTQRRELLTMIVDQYSKILKPGGIVLFQSNDDGYGFSRFQNHKNTEVNLIELFTGYDCKYRQLKDSVCTVKLPLDQYKTYVSNQKQQVKSGFGAPVDLQKFDGFASQNYYYLHIRREGHNGGDFYVFTKKC
jgi:hypothetical protein